MKKVMKGFYNATEKESKSAWGSEKTLFVFDTNVLLNLYSYAEQTRNDFFSVMGKIKDRVWIPYHVALEYQRRRIGVIKNEKHIFSKIDDNLGKIKSVFSKDFKSLLLEDRIPHLAESTKRLELEIDKLFEEYKANLKSFDKNQPSVNAFDLIRDKLDRIFEERVGDKPENQQKLDEIYNEGKDRYEKKIPPGYKDSSKKQSDEPEFSWSGLRYERQYGDLIIWKQVIDKASIEDIEAVIFVTDDSKEDWWQIEDSRGEKIIGPRPELIEEIRSQADINLFMMCNVSDFLKIASENLRVKIDKESLADANNLFESVKSSRETAGGEKENQEKLKKILLKNNMFIMDDEIHKLLNSDKYSNLKLNKEVYDSVINKIRSKDLNDYASHIRESQDRASNYLDVSKNLDDVISYKNEINNSLREILLKTMLKNEKSVDKNDDNEGD